MAAAAQQLEKYFPLAGKIFSVNWPREREREVCNQFWPWHELQFWFGTLCITLKKCCCSIFYVNVVVALLLLLLLLGLSDAVVSGRAALWNLWFIECAWKTVRRADTVRDEGQGARASSRLPIVPTGKNKSIEFISRNNKTVKWRTANGSDVLWISQLCCEESTGKVTTATAHGDNIN